MSQPAIHVENLGKEYQLGLREKGNNTFREMLIDLAAMPLKRFQYLTGKYKKAERIWALRDVSFDVQPGEVVGIIGRNGAGKSTLLKILTKITEPTTGRAEVHGHVGSLLEVGTGFHPELTGRENIFLNGAILGMPRTKIKQKFDEIVDFSGVEKFIDTPVKRYSSGMGVRLAFAVAAHLDPEILLIDEVLAVGDVEFQKKCLGKMRDVAVHGRTVLFVSHNMGAVTDLCSRTMLLQDGAVLKDGPCREIVEAYLSAGSAEGFVDLSGDFPDRTGNGPMRVQSVATLNAEGQCQSLFTFEDTITIRCTVQGNQGTTCIMGASIRTLQGQLILHLTNTDARTPVVVSCEQQGVFITLPAHTLNNGEYLITIWLGDGCNILNDRVGNCLAFQIDGSASGSMRCVAPIICPGVWRTRPSSSTENDE